MNPLVLLIWLICTLTLHIILRRMSVIQAYAEQIGLGATETRVSAEPVVSDEDRLLEYLNKLHESNLYGPEVPATEPEEVVPFQPDGYSNIMY